jgi:transposase-like protein
MRHTITDYQKARILELYSSRESTLKIGRLLQLSPTTVNRWLHRCGVTLREPRETSTRCQVRHDAFDEITPDAAYWIGFLFADGSVSDDGRSRRISVRVSERDRNQMTIRADKTIFQIATAGYIAERIVVFLYGNATVALDRKAATAAKIEAMRDARLSAERARLTQIADWYQDGASLKQIGLRLGVSDVTILHWMEKAGIPRRERHGGRRRAASS